MTEQNVLRAIEPTLVPADGTSGLDVDYLWWLDSDSVSVLAASLDRLSEPERTLVDSMLAGRSLDLEQTAASGWPSWNLARTRALEALRSAGY